MSLAFISHKVCWTDSSSPSGYATVGGFPFHVQAISQIFDATTLLVPIRVGTPPTGVQALTGNNLHVEPLSEPVGRGLGRKLALLAWLPKHLPLIWNAIRAADAVHTPIPGDLGTLGLLVALLQRKRLFVRHCGNWAVQTTTAQHFWKWIMERYAGGRNVMLATGGGPHPPSDKNLAIRWIFSTSLTEDELARYARIRSMQADRPPRLIIACRQERDKQTDVVIASMPHVLETFPGATLDVVGDGSALPSFRAQARDLGVADNVAFHGRVTHERVMTLFQQADLFCYPTAASEGFPKVVLEALASGLPVMTTPVSVLPHLIGEGGGVILDEVSPEGLAEAVCALLRDPARYRSMSEQAVATARCYSLEQWQASIEQVLRDAWGEPLRAHD